METKSYEGKSYDGDFVIVPPYRLPAKVPHLTWTGCWTCETCKNPEFADYQFWAADRIFPRIQRGKGEWVQMCRSCVLKQWGDEVVHYPLGGDPPRLIRDDGKE